MKKNILSCFFVIFSLQTFGQSLYVVEDSITGLNGLINIDKEVVLPYEYEELEPLDCGYFASIKKSKLGLVDSLGRVRIPNNYVFGFFAEDNEVAFMEKDGKMGLVDFDNKILIPFIYDNQIYQESKKDVLRVRQNGKYGLIDFNLKKEILPCKYDRIKIGSVLYDNGLVKVYNERSSDLIAVLSNSKWGFVNLKGEMVIPCKFEDSSILDEEGSDEFDKARYYYIYQGGRSPFVKKGKVGMIDEKGNEILPPIYKHINLEYSVDYPTVTTFDDKQMLINKENKIVTQAYDEVLAIDNDFAIYKISGKYGLISLPDFKVVTKAEYDGFRNSSDGIIRFEKDEKYGYMNKAGQELFQPNYEDGYSFQNGYCVVKKEGKYGYLKSYAYSGTYIDCIYDKAYNIDDNGIGVVKKEGKYGAINIMKKNIIPFDFDDIEFDSENNLYRVTKDKLYGYYNQRGQVIVPCKFSKDVCEVEKRFYLSNQKKEQIGKTSAGTEEEILVKSMSLVINDLSASMTDKMRLDTNGSPCALIRVMLKDSDPKFEGNIVGSIIQRGMQYFVYMASGSKYLRVAPADHFPITISFSDYNINALDSKKTYDLILVTNAK